MLFDLSETLARIVDECATDGMTPPFIICAASPNGSAFVARMKNGRHTDVLATHVENGGLKIPMSVHGTGSEKQSHPDRSR